MRPLRIPVLGAVLSLAATAFIGPAVAVASETETAAEILREGAQLGVDNGYPGVIGLVRDGTDTAYVQAGLGDRFTRVPADPQARFRIGSNTKAFIATVLLQLEAEDRLSLDDTLDTWLPDVFARSGHDGSTITVRQLLNHTSGLPEYLNDPRVLASYAANLNPYRKWEPRKLVEIALRQGATGAPGERHSYSNTNYLLAGMVIEAVTGNPPHVEVRQRIISPLGLHDTSFPTDPRPQGEWLRGYFRIGGFLRDVTVSNVDITGSAGAMVSTLDDLATFERALLSGELLPEPQLAALKDTVPLTEDGSAGAGLGVFLTPTPCGPVWQHSGALLGYTTLWLTSDDGDKQVVVAANEYHLVGGGPGEQHIARAAVEAYCAL
ncbi:serine hydrolase domain-containing protein [Saccharomonospora viridis]|uniref:serine hydrolase domain-containing protein n=1 Tax=Saccharomonospora viridis TaxID=1852 RepID=UPI0023F4C8FF|nr:serine hydrolase domain-containing protein [Saccharomonospora viridis]